MELKRHKNKEYLKLLNSLLGYESRILWETIRILKKELAERVVYYYTKKGEENGERAG